MIDPTAGTGAPLIAAPKPQKILKMVTNDRMAGAVPAWVDSASPSHVIEQRLSAAQNAQAQKPGTYGLAYAYNGEPGSTAPDNEAFGFADILDMVNPLQHIPLVNTLYREVTGDTIKPVSRIIGGGVFGGPIGVAGGLVNLVVEEETGRDVTGNVLAFVTKGETPHYKTKPVKPETQIAQALESIEQPPDLPASLLAFTAPAVSAAPKMLHNDSSRYNS